MGLSLAVGVLAETLENDVEASKSLEREFVLLNKILVGTGLSEHHEPVALDAKDRFQRDMMGYNGLHYVRRLGYYLSTGQELPMAGPNYSNYSDMDEDLGFSSKKNAYDEYIDTNIEDLVLNCPDAALQNAVFVHTSRKDEKYIPFLHLIIHGDADGVYLPQPFRSLRMFSAPSDQLGLIIGSCHTLMEECQLIANAMGIPGGYTGDEDEFDELIDSQGIGEGWKRYGIEAYGCLSLIEACKASIKTGAALVFQ